MVCRFPSARLATVCALLALSLQLPAQQQPPAGTAPPGGRRGRGGAGAQQLPGGGGGAAYPSRPPADPAVLERGKALWDQSCSSCHAADLRGSNRGVNLVRSKLVLDDQNGELIGPFIAQAHAAGGAPAVNWTPQQLADVSTFMHSFQNYRTIMMPVPLEMILVGDAKAGAAYFSAHCAACHSVDGSPSQAASLKGIASRMPNAKLIQNALVSGGAGGRGRGGAPVEDGGDAGGGRSARAVTATLTWPNGKKVEGTLVSKDDFVIVVNDRDGLPVSYRRDGDVPQVELHDPMKAHRDFLITFTNKDIHDLTAYLETLK